MKDLSGTGGAVSSKHATLLAIRCALFANNFLFNRKVRKEGAKEMQSLLPHHDLCDPLCVLGRSLRLNLLL
jgi:hypothetical protein